MPDPNPGLMTLFTDALAISDSAERAAYLDHACGGDANLRRRVEELLAAHPGIGRFLEPDRTSAHVPAPADATGTFDSARGTVDLPSDTSPTGTVDPEAHRPKSMGTGDYRPDGATGTYDGTPALREPAFALELGSVIAGRYTLTEIIGEGGMGSVYLASQTEPVKRQVALKLIKTGMDSKGVLARFDAERQALALMDHPNIARIYDGGVTEKGQPFFVMELVKGVPLTEYCDEKRLSVDARLQLFVQVCHAVQHAHQKGIIHRDLKPGNVLVTEVDGRPAPKVIDFGVAKATEQKLTDISFADVGAIVGTPAYMSPEQADPSSMDIDTRTDVYALGVILYELLTGSPPIDSKQFKRGAILEMLRMVREVEPPRPSTKLSTADALPNIAASRSIEPAKLSKLLQGELDWVVMKAIEKDRVRRYETANAFARDIQRYLADEVVEARPPSVGYRVSKFVRRHKGQVIAVSLVLFVLVAGMAGTTWGLFEAKRQEKEAKEQEQTARGEAAAKEKARQAAADRAEGERLAKLEAQAQKTRAEQATAAEKAANAQAQKRLAQIEKANDILGSIFENLDPKEIARAERPLQVILVEKLDKAVAQLEGESIGDPLVVAAMQHKFGSSLLSLGEAGKATVLLEKARATCQAKLDPDHPDTLASMNSLATAYQAAGKLDLALPLFEETLKLRKAKSGPEHPFTLTSMNNLALAYKDAGKLDLALPLFEETLKLENTNRGPEHPFTLTSMNNLALAYLTAGKQNLALPLFEETLKLRKAKSGPEHPDTLTSMNNLALAYLAAGKQNLALSLHEETLKLRKAKFGAEHPDTLQSMNNLASAYLAAGKRDLALALFEETLKLNKAKFGPEHPNTLQSMNNLAVAYKNAGKLDLALPLYEETLKLAKAKFGPEHPNTLRTMNNLAVAYREAGKVDRALPLYEESLRFAKANLGPEHPDTLTRMGSLGKAYCDANQVEKAAATFQELVTLHRKRAKPDDPQFPRVLASFASELLKCRQHAAAEPLLRECLAIREKAEPDAWTTFNTHSLLGGALLGQKKYADAEPLLVKGYEGLKAREKSIPPQGAIRVPEALDRLIELYTATNKPDEVKKYKELRAKYPSPKEVAPQPRERK